jgi:hypothetical protein
VEQLREISRQHYLEKREEKELKLLEMGAYFSLLGINMIHFCISILLTVLVSIMLTVQCMTEL